jgi:hypothetical protein
LQARIARVSTSITLPDIYFSGRMIDLISSPESLPLYFIDRSITKTMKTMDTSL